MVSIRFKSPRAMSVRSDTAGRVAMLAAAIVASGCGVVANRTPLPPGTPVASVHVGPVTGGFRWQTVTVHDGSQCAPGNFKRFHTIGSYLGSALDMEVPANRPVFYSLGDGENQGLRKVSCGTTAALVAAPGVKYTMNLLYEGNWCGIVVTNTATGERVKTEPVAAKCPG